jgi:4'-phosphopantetheinyl transferase
MCAVTLAPTGEVEVWTVALDAPDAVAAVSGWLSGRERGRVERFVRPESKRRYAVARGTLRALLARRLGVEPGDVQFVYSRFGKPSLAGSSLAFNISHSGELALIGVAAGGAVGVDLEWIQARRPVDRLAPRVLVDSELARLAVAPDRALEFHRFWTAKEAIMKLYGFGMRLEASRIVVASSGAPDSALATVAPQDGALMPEGGGGPVYVRWVELPAGYAGAVTGGPGWRLAPVAPRLAPR